MKIGIDLGGSHIGVGLVKNDGIILRKKEKDIVKEDKEKIKDIIEQTIRKFIHELLIEEKISIKEIEMIGIASPGTVKDGTIYHMVNLGIETLEIREMLNRYFELPIQVKNDAKCAGIAEFLYGSMKEYEDGIFLSIGTGIGGAVYVNNRLLEPKTNAGMEFGHMIIEKEGKECKCGNRGCFETYCSMKNLKEKVKTALDLNANTSSEMVVRKIKEEQNQGLIKEILDEYISYFSIGLTNLINIFEPEIVCLGGSFAYLGEEIVEKIKKQMKENNLLFNKRRELNIVLATLGNNAGLIGAANIPSDNQ